MKKAEQSETTKSLSDFIVGFTWFDREFQSWHPFEIMYTKDGTLSVLLEDEPQQITDGYVFVPNTNK